MTRLPSLRPRVVINGLHRGGFVDVRARGGHYQLRNPTSGRRVTVPYHNRDLTRSNPVVHYSPVRTDGRGILESALNSLDRS